MKLKKPSWTNSRRTGTNRGETKVRSCFCQCATNATNSHVPVEELKLQNLSSEDLLFANPNHAIVPDSSEEEDEEEGSGPDEDKDKDDAGITATE